MGEQVAASANGDVAQLGEHLPCKQGVESSNLFISTCGKREKVIFAAEYASMNIDSRHTETVP